MRIHGWKHVGGRKARLAGAVLLVALGSAACVPPLQYNPIDPIVGTVGPGSSLVGCDRAGDRIVLAASGHLDPSCVYTRGVTITTSNTTLDCRGARIERGTDESDRLGIEVVAPFNVALANVTIRNCVVQGFSNNLRIRRDDFKDLEFGHEYDHPFSNILVENSHFYDSEGSGIFVDGFMTGVTLRTLEVSGSGAVGIYLEAGSKGTLLENSKIHHNGFADVTPEGVPIVVNGTEFRYQSTGREGVAIDGSRDNVIRHNWIAANASGGIFLYKNCGEDAESNPDGHWVRHYGATGNLVEDNLISTEKNGVWAASRMAENQYFMDCSDAPYVSSNLRLEYLDPATDNIIRGNRFVSVTNGIRIEDNRNRVENNNFRSLVATDNAVLIGTKDRTAVLGQPVDGTVITGNKANIDGNSQPYGWVWGHTNTTFSQNSTNGAPATLAPGTQPRINPFLFAISIRPA